MKPRGFWRKGVITSDYRSKRRNEEAQLQALFCGWLNQRGILYVASLMGVNLGARVGAIRKRMGCRAGVPDVLILEARPPYHGCGVELKVKGGHITPEQTAFAKHLEDNGYKAIIMPTTLEFSEGLEWVQNRVDQYLEMADKLNAK